MWVPCAQADESALQSAKRIKNEGTLPITVSEDAKPAAPTIYLERVQDGGAPLQCVQDFIIHLGDCGSLIPGYRRRVFCTAHAAMASPPSERYLLADEVLAAVYPNSGGSPLEALMRCFQKVFSKSDAAQLPQPAMPKR